VARLGVLQWRLQTARVGGPKGGQRFLKGGRGLGDGSFPAGSRGGAPVGGVGDEVPQKPKHFA